VLPQAHIAIHAFARFDITLLVLILDGVHRTVFLACPAPDTFVSEYLCHNQPPWNGILEKL